LARKDGSTLRPKFRESWVALGVDTSVTAMSMVATGYDGVLDRLVTPSYGEIRWMPEVDWFDRLGQAARGHLLLLDVMARMPEVPLSRVYLACEEPFHYGAMQRQVASFAKQQAELAGAFKGSLVRYGITNIWEINNSQWYAVLRRDGVEFESTRGLTGTAKKLAQLANKMRVKTWAMAAYGLPDLPDLVESKSGAKIPRPESGPGANRRAIQPNDVYDAAGVLAWLVDELDTLGITN
jgi:hypothetical protein